MEFQTLKKSHLKRNIIIGVLVVGIISAVVLNFTKAKYRTTQSIPLVNGTINYSLADLNIVAITIDGSEVDTIPDGNYELTSESYCTINGEKDSNVKLSYDSTTKGLSVTPMTTKGTKCYLDFKEKELAKDIILTNSKVNEGEPDFSQIATTDEGVYKTQDDWGDSYYFRGAVNNNWVKFAGFYWRIVRINGDGSIRIIYHGTGTSLIDNNTIIGEEAFSDKESSSEYVGYMYTKENQHGNTEDSLIKKKIDSWYENYLIEYENFLSMEAGFCGDREVASGYSWSSQPSKLRYQLYERLYENKNPTLKCNNALDLYTVSGSSKGNKALANPIGLITADEVSMAGGVYAKRNSKYYLSDGNYYWTMSPSYYSSELTATSKNYIITSDGDLFVNSLSADYGVRPVINIASNVVIKSGNGTSSTPYEI